MNAETSSGEDKPVTAKPAAPWVAPAITAIVSLIAGMLLASYNFGLATNRFFLEKQAKTADDVAVEFSRYVDNWSRLMRMRRHFDAMKTPPGKEEREFFKKAVYERASARDKLFSSLDATHLYYSDKVSSLVVEFRTWDDKQAELTIEKLPDIKEWQKWQIDVLRALREEIRK
ncbi:MAG: hypothetical protein HZA62_05515 [Rhodocyclales bacterium]|nr:hypothetical protein [Rhodocyclales bacterium]